MFANSFARAVRWGDPCRSCLTREGVERQTVITLGGVALCVSCDDIPEADRTKAGLLFARDRRRDGAQ